MTTQPQALRTLTSAEAARVTGGFSADEFLSYSITGAAVGAPVGAVLLGSVSMLYGAAMGAFIGGFFGGAYYAGSELFDYCF